jgi:DNA-binding MarR family transcriptional regulator
MNENTMVENQDTSMRQQDHVDKVVAEWDVQDKDREMGKVQLIVRMIRISAILERELSTLAKYFDVKPGQFEVLSALRRAHPMTLSPSDLIQGTLLSSGAMTPLVDRLEAKALVRRLADPKDGRSVRVALTPEGLTVIDRVLSDRLARFKALMARLDPGEGAAAAASLRKILMYLEAPTD